MQRETVNYLSCAVKVLSLKSFTDRKFLVFRYYVRDNISL